MNPIPTEAMKAAPRTLAWMGSFTCRMGRPSTSAKIWHQTSELAPPPTMITAFKTGERTTGKTKQCYYESLGNQHTQTIVAIGLCPLSIPVRSATTPTPALQPMMTTAYKTGERTAGLIKQCFYNGISSENTRTIKSVGLCPLSIWVRPRH